MTLHTDLRPNAGFYRELPKVELHRHLEGSLRVDSLRELLRSGAVDPVDVDGHNLHKLVQIQPDDEPSFTVFLEKFKTLRLFYNSPEIIRRITREAIADAVEDNIRYLELRFTPVALSRVKGFTLGEVMDWVCDSARQASQDNHVPVGLIVSVNRHESADLAEAAVQSAVDHIARGVVGIDLAGNEAEFSAGPFQSIFKDARKAGLHVTIHAGEWGEAENIRQAILDFEAERIGHGVRILEDSSVVALARERATPLEMCLSSNYQSGVVPSIQSHPFPAILAAGLNASLHTDDPGVSQITLSSEYQLACEQLKLPIQTLFDRILSAARAAFLPPDSRQELIEELESSFTKIQLNQV